jgi:thiol-disulfide isomerase/thioredoxin
MWKKTGEFLKKNGFWLALLIILLVPGIRNPLQILFNKGFSYVNWVQVEAQPTQLDLTELSLLNTSDKIIDGNYFKGKVLFINFWATWCPPCIAEMSSIQELKKSYEGEVEFILISNEDLQKTQQFFDKKSFDFESYQPLKIPEVFKVKSIPRTFIINAKGEIIIDKAGAVNWNSAKVKEIIDQAIANNKSEAI